MSTKQSTIDYILDQLISVEGMSSRKMFGEYALYCRGKVVALICDDCLFVKITEQGKEYVGKHYQEGFAYPGAKASVLIDNDQIENRNWLSDLIEITYQNLPDPKPKNQKK